MSDWKKDDEALDELLNHMPKFTDHRSKEDVYNLVKQKVEAHEKEQKKHLSHKNLSRWLPLVVSIASIILITFLVSSYRNNDNSIQQYSTSKEMEEKSSEEESMQSMDRTEESAITNDESENESSDDMSKMTIKMESNIDLIPIDTLNAVYEEDLNGGTVFHFSFNENALTVPVTIIIPKEQVEVDFPNMVPNSLQLYERYASLINEEALGFTEYHPYKGYFVAENQLLTHYLPKDHGYDTASGTSAPYWSSLNEIFKDFESVALLNEDGSLLEWDQVGILNEPSKLEGLIGHHNYYNYRAQNGNVYLTPNFSSNYDTISEAFLDMKNVGNDIYTSVVPSTVTYSYENRDGVAVIKFDEPFDLESLEPNEATRLIEAFALTAASFGTEVKLENLVQEQWDKFNFNNTLPKPLGPNGFIMSVK
ncbi:hypothetical protein WAX74_01995 [Psychrobacillus sp. FJAT-51614]|uniref:Sigma-X negative effector n=1 Tax=Psychrobacillus mangrovi TaxID=3117745 RepID=A0ABU8F0F0_9BACI